MNQSIFLYFESPLLMMNALFSKHRFTNLSIVIISVACDIGPSVNPLQNRETQHVNNVLQCMCQLFEQPNMKGNHVSIEW